ncbi:sulfite exporter TauE/SafE family protein [Nereida sp. MMG025]|uniref:sulfite exporter TauE/SafE family protein n=1 Tax=Nereida sp. MMG025 TaxID=2909981 RepID=UPI001F221008|nr:sulfite exporter TauE/SafE family protein [Nereida sp. MMG025]MCF6445427.1 sulfite exporter TauE/SafE family protein [Nereida sp. MMG025]
MPDAWPLLVGAVLVAGLVRGFAGFGTAMIYLPVAGQVLDPFAAIVTLIVMDIIGPLPAVPRAIKEGHPRDVLRLWLGMSVMVPVGLSVLTVTQPQVFRYGVSGISLCLLICLIFGLRYSGVLKRWMIYATGALSGFLGGVAGLAGPPVILLYMASPHPPKVIRANTMLFLVLVDVTMIAVLGAMGRLSGEAILIGATLILPYMAGVLIGTRLFDPTRETLYTRVAYLIITVSALSGLPLWD